MSTRRSSRTSLRSKNIGTILQEMNLVTAAQVDKAVQIQSNTSALLGQILVKLGYLNPDDLAHALKKQFNVTDVIVSQVPIDVRAVQRVPREDCEKFKLLPFELLGDLLCIAMANPLNRRATTKIEADTELKVKPFKCPWPEIKKRMEQVFGAMDRQNIPHLTPAEGSQAAEKDAGESTPKLVSTQTPSSTSAPKLTPTSTDAPAQSVLRPTSRVDAAQPAAEAEPKPPTDEYEAVEEEVEEIEETPTEPEPEPTADASTSETVDKYFVDDEEEFEEEENPDNLPPQRELVVNIDLDNFDPGAGEPGGGEEGAAAALEEPEVEGTPEPTVEEMEEEAAVEEPPLVETPEAVEEEEAAVEAPPLVETPEAVEEEEAAVEEPPLVETPEAVEEEEAAVEEPPLVETPEAVEEEEAAVEEPPLVESPEAVEEEEAASAAEIPEVFVVDPADFPDLSSIGGPAGYEELDALINEDARSADEPVAVETPDEALESASNVDDLVELGEPNWELFFDSAPNTQLNTIRSDDDLSLLEIDPVGEWQYKVSSSGPLNPSPMKTAD